MQSLSKPALTLAGVQWLFFMFANTIVVPLSVGAAFQLPDAEVAAILRSSFIFTGVASIAQAYFGHRYPLMEGHSGLWWGLILSLCASAPAVGLSYAELGGSLALGMIFAGIATVVLGAFGFAETLKRIFNEIVLTVYLFLLSCQLIMIFFKGMLGLSTSNVIDFPVAALSIGVVILVLLLTVKGKGKVGNFSILIGIMVGWIAYRLLFPESPRVVSEHVGFYTFLPWGPLRLDSGILMSAFFAGLINMSNSIVAIRSAEQLLKTKTSEKSYRWSFVLTGVNTVIAGLFGLVPYGPYTSSIGFLESTKMVQRAPFILGGAFFVVLGLVPALGAFFSTLPMSIGDAVLFVAYLQLFATALKNIRKLDFGKNSHYRLSIPILVGLSVMNISPETFAQFPIYIQPIVSNGLLVGVLLSVVLEWGSKQSEKKNRVRST